MCCIFLILLFSCRVDHVQLNNEKCALIVCSNHAIGDQKSFNTIVSELLANINGVLDDRTTMEVHAFPPSVEQAVAPGLPGFRTALWAAVQIWNTLRRPTLVPRHMPKDSGIEPRAISYEKLIDPDQRRTFTRQFQLTAAETAGLLSAVKRQQQQKQQLSPQAAVNHRPNSNLGRLTVTDALSAAMLAVSNVMLQEDVPGFVSAASSSDASLAGINSNINRIQSKMMRFLLAVGLRGYGKSKEDFTGGTVSSASGAVDYVTSSTPDLSRSSMPWAATSPTLPPQLSEEFRRCFWELAAQCRERSEDLLQKWQLVPESVRLFHIGMRLQEAGYADILRAVEIDAHNPRTLGRGYTCGVSNMGVVDFTVVGKGAFLFHWASHGSHYIVYPYVSMLVNCFYLCILHFYICISTTKAN